MNSQSSLNRIATSCADKIEKAKLNKEFFNFPFKHLVIDDFLATHLAKICLENFPPISNKCWLKYDTKDIEIKYRTNWKSEFDIPNGIVDAIRIFNSSLILKAISKRFGINKLIPDPYFSGGGLNVTTQGGLLDVHIDGNYHDATGLNRRMNIILYLNKNWNEEWGGSFGLYTNDGKKCVKKISPLFNRVVIFDSHDRSFHGLPEPLRCPKSQTRKSIILYYYTKEKRPKNQIIIDKPHSALWVKKNLTDKKGLRTRKFK
jgi:Rps23 Pro-64 3,4-dihydroxylase Tpa1-like proline 4-hydroxylase